MAALRESNSLAASTILAYTRDPDQFDKSEGNCTQKRAAEEENSKPVCMQGSNART